MHPTHEVRIAVVGKYMKHRDAYKSVYESLDHAGIANRARVIVQRVEAEEVSGRGAEGILGGVDGILVPGGFGMRGIEGKIEAIRYARTRGIPFFGICLGMQCAAVEFARSVLGLDDANSTEFDKHTQHPVISLMEDQSRVRQRGGTMRLGAWPASSPPRAWPAPPYGADRDQRAPPAPLRVQQRLPQAVRRARVRRHRPEPRRQPRRDPRTPRPPLVPLGPVPPRVQVEADQAHPLFREFIAAALVPPRGERAELEPAR